MKVAIVHELLTVKGGAERVAKVFADMFPQAPVFTLLYDERKLGDWFPASRVRVSTLQRYAFLSTNHHLYLRSFPAAVEAWDFSEFDLVLGSSSAFAHGIITNGKPKHLCYVHSPARYLWDATHEVIARASTGIFGPLTRSYLSKTFHRLRVWDSEAADRPDLLLANSKEVQRRIELYWRRESAVLHPPIEDFWFHAPSPSHPVRERDGEPSPYLIVSTLAAFKRIDLAIEACNTLKRPLVIVGEGRERTRLERIAGPTVTFLGRQDDEQVRESYATAKAVIFPGRDDFGLVPVEALACGCPVIAYGQGGALETTIEGETGELFYEPTKKSLIEAIARFEGKTYDRERLATRVKEYSRARFEQDLQKHIDQLMRSAFFSPSLRVAPPSPAGKE